MSDLVMPSTAEARALTDRIKVAVEGTWLLIQEAYTSRTWAALGYETWDAYVDAEFRTARLALPKEERAETIQSLRAAGMSVRAISSATGVGVGTVHRELSGAANVPNGTMPERVTTTDGRSYPASRPAPQDDPDLLAGDDWVQPSGPGFEAALTPPSKPKRRPLPEAFTDAGRDFVRAAERLGRLTEDDRFPKNRDTTHHQLPELLGALDNTTRLIQAMHLHQAQTSAEARRWWATSLHKISDALTDVANSIEQEQ